MLKALSLVCLIVLGNTAIGSEPITVFSGEGERTPKQPQACIDSQGVVHLTFGVGEDVHFCTIMPDGIIDQKSSIRIPNMSLGMRRGPRIALSQDSVVITVIGGPQGKGRDGDILSYRSIDGGKNWFGPVKVNDVDDSAREGLHAMAASDDGTLWCVWLDLREKGMQLFAAKSVDQGATWSKNQLVYRSESGSVCECCHPSILADQNSVHVLFRNSLKGNRDMYLISSEDRGESFGPAVRLGLEHWQLNACPMDGGMLAWNHDKQISTVWRRDRSLLVTGSNPGRETFLDAGDQPWIASDGEGFYKVWTSKRDGDLFLLRPEMDKSENIGKNASFPVVTGNSKSKTTWIFWESRTGNSVSVLGMKASESTTFK